MLRVGSLSCAFEVRTFLDSAKTLQYIARLSRGAIAQLGERLHGMQEVAGSIPASSTKPYRLSCVPIV
jgi:hypothetical protein